MVLDSMEKKFRVQCPTCKAFYRCAISTPYVEHNADGSTMFVIKPSACNHLFLVFLDAKMNARSAQALQDIKVDTMLIRGDSTNLFQKEKDLVEKHQEAIDTKDYTAMDMIWEELKRIRRDISRMGMD